MKRFFEKVEKTDSCWNWTGAISSNGYGSATFESRRISSHRLSWILCNGEIPNGLFVLHTCDNRKCVNPGHLFLGTQKDNMQDCYKKGRMFIPKEGNFKNGHLPVNALLSNEEAIVIKDLIKSGQLSLADISRKFNVPYQLIKDINCGRSYINV